MNMKLHPHLEISTMINKKTIFLIRFKSTMIFNIRGKYQEKTENIRLFITN